MNTKQFARRSLSFLLALVMLLGMVPFGAFAAEGETSVYLKPNSNWHQSDARFAVYYFKDDANGWTDMTDEDEDGFYEATVPDGYTVIFCRMNPETTENNWDNKWNQTADLTLPTDGRNCYTLPEDSWDKGAGSWSEYVQPEIPEETETPTETEATEETEAPAEPVYIVAGTDVLCGTAWDPANTNNTMVPDEAAGLYAITYCNVPAGSHEFKVTDGTWNNSWGNGGGNYTFTLEKESHVTVLFNAETKEISISVEAVPVEPSVNYYLFGYINGANYGCEEDSANLGEYRFVGGQVTATFTAESYVAVKTDANGWYMTDGWLGDVTSATLYNTAVIGSNANKLKVPANVEVTFTLEVNDDDTLTLSCTREETGGEETPAATYIIAGDGSLCGAAWDPADTANRMQRNAQTGLYEKVYTNVPAGTYALKVTDGTWDNSWGADGQNYTFDVTAPCDVTITFDEASRTVTAAGENVGKAELAVETISAVGNGSGSWLNGNAWDVAANTMTEIAENVYEISYQAVLKGNYEVKFAANGAWTHNWGGTFAESGVEAEAVYNAAGNITFAVSCDAADVTLKLDLTGFDPATMTGGKFTITITEVAAPEIEYTYTVHYANAENWANVKAHGWTSGGDLFGGWPGTDAAANADNEGWYDVTVTTNVSSIGILFHNGEGAQTRDASVAVPEGQTAAEVWITGTDPVAVSYAEPDGWGGKTGSKVQLHFWKPETWGANVNAWVWADSGSVPGYEDYHQTWPGKAIFENAGHAGWFDLTVVTELDKFYFIFNDGGNQTADLETGDITGDTELWIVGNDVLTEAPGAWEGRIEYTANIHFRKPAAWGETVNAWIWDAGGAIPGYEQYQTAWPGAAIDADAVNDGWYNVSVTTLKQEGFSFILNDGASQTADLSTGALETRTDLWIVDGEVLTEVPEGWIDSNRTVHVPGTFPGPSWDAASNQMTYDPDLGLYVYTFGNVPAANYEYKIAINGSWGENYGAAGEKDGSNIAVAVTETRDVTVYYNDQTHNSVTDVTYVFADITLKGTGIPEGTRLTDTGLTGIYSAEVMLTAGTYEDVALNYEQTDYTFAPFTLEEDKAVTFYFDPATGIYYHNGSDEKVAEDQIFFDSKDEAYKTPFGAVATGEQVIFTIATGDDVTDVKLVVKGVKSYTMEKVETLVREAGVQKWTCTAVFNTIGEFDYYFTVSNGSDVKVYGDDDGNYGTGMVTSLKNVIPYDLVVYEAGFETPDWMKNAVIYQIFPDRFFDGDVTNNQAQTTARGAVDYEYISKWYTLPENPEQEALLDEATYKSTGAWYGDGEWSNEIYGGDLEGITQQIDYLKALGVNVIYLNPVFSSISSHRYDACDYMTIDPILGDLGDFEELVAVAEANDMHIILDGVFNHVSDDSVYFDRYYKFLGKSEKIGAYPYWAYVYDHMAENKASQADAEAAAKAYFTENYGITDYSYTGWFLVENKAMAGAVDTIGLRAGKSVYSYEGWWGYDSMPVIRSTNGSEYQTGNWAQEIISGSDSVTQYWITKGNNGWRLDVANEVSDETWKNFRDSVKGLDSDAVIIGEIWDDATKYLKGDMYDSVMNYLFRNAVTEFAMGRKNSEEATDALERIRERYPEEAFYAMMNLVGSHDTTRILSYLDGIGDDRNQKDIDFAFPTYEKTSGAAKQMQYLVAFLQFTYPGAPTIYYGDEIGMVGSDDPDDRRAFEWGKGSRELVEWYARLAAIRKAYPALRTGDLTVINTENANLMGYTRSLKGRELIVLANNAASSVAYPVDGSYMDLITGEAYEGTVPGRSGVILVEKRGYKAVSVDSAALAPAYDASTIVGSREEGHVHDYTFTSRVTAPTCTEKGWTEYGCQCGAVQKDDFVDALGHSYVSEVVGATCSAKGYTEHTCQVCGDSYRDAVKPKNLRNHGETELKNRKEATCTHRGYTGDEVCKDCGRTVKLGKYTRMADHAYEDGVCTSCGDVQNRYTPGDIFNKVVDTILDILYKIFPW